MKFRDMLDVAFMILKVVVSSLLAIALGVGIITWLALGAVSCVEYRELASFNRINNTTYTLDEWRIYEYDIKKQHPLFEEEK